MKDWKVLAPAALDIPIRNRDDATAAGVMLEAAMFIIERAYPSRRYASDEVVDRSPSLLA